MSDFLTAMKLLGYSIGKTRKYPKKALYELKKIAKIAAKKPEKKKNPGLICENCKNPIKQQNPLGLDDFFNSDK